MLTEQDAQDLMTTFIRLRTEMNASNDPIIVKEFKKHEKTCAEKFDYLITMKTGRYKAFSNHEDLKQEGRLALVNAMVNYDPAKGSFFWWAHKYIDTRISRSANLHTTIRFPLKVAKENAPHKESILPTLIEERYCPDKELDQAELLHSIETAMAVLSDQQRDIIHLAFGFDGDKPLSVNKICKKLGLSRSTVTKSISTSQAIMKEKIKI